MNWQNYILVLAGGYLQMPLCKEIKQRGYDLFLVDGNPDCVCRAYADKFLCIDTYDLDTQIDLVNSLSHQNHKPAAILTDAADLGISVATLCYLASLPSTPLDVAQKVNNKLVLHTVIPEYMPTYLDTTDLSVTEAFIAWHNLYPREFPLVLKPTNSCGSRGVVKIDTIREFENNYGSALQFQKFNDNSLFIEAYIHGIEIATDWFVVAGVPRYINGATRVFNEFGMELGHINPFWPMPAEVRQIVQTLCTRVNYNNGPLKADFIYDGCRWYLLEAATRWSGGFDHAFTAKLATGRNLIAPLLDFALGIPVNLPELAYDRSLYAAALGLYYNTDKYNATKIKDLPNDIEVHLTGNLGSACAARNLWLLATGKDEIDAWNRVVTARQILAR